MSKFLCRIGILLISSFVLLSCNKDDDDNYDPNKNITSFVFSAEINNLKDDITGSINQNERTIRIETLDWIENIEKLKPTFVSQGTVKIGNIEQVSSETENSFKQDVVYTITDQSGAALTYTVSLVSPQTSGLPVIIIDIEEDEEITEKKDEYNNANIKVIDENPEYCFEKATGIRGRGNSTWGYPKKPWRLKFDKKTSMFGLGAEKSWVLLANYLDPTVLMNDIAFETGHRLGLEFTNHSIHVELFMNGTYRGNYQLTEQVQVNKNRVNIDEDEGFLLELDDYFDEEWKFYSDILKLPVMVKSPELTNEAGMGFIKKAVNDLENAMYANNFPNSGYRDLIDVESLINFMLVNDFVGNREIRHPKSLYMYRDKGAGSKIHLGPLWDFDWGFGYAEYGHIYFNNIEVLFTPGKDEPAGYEFFSRFLDDPQFKAEYKARWNEIKTTQLSTLTQYIDNMSAKLEKSQYLNYKRWTNYQQLEFKDEINKMKNWIVQRINILDAEISKM